MTFEKYGEDDGLSVKLYKHNFVTTTNVSSFHDFDEIILSILQIKFMNLSKQIINIDKELMKIKKFDW